MTAPTPSQVIAQAIEALEAGKNWLPVGLQVEKQIDEALTSLRSLQAEIAQPAEQSAVPEGKWSQEDEADLTTAYMVGFSNGKDAARREARTVRMLTQREREQASAAWGSAIGGEPEDFAIRKFCEVNGLTLTDNKEPT